MKDKKLILMLAFIVAANLFGQSNSKGKVFGIVLDAANNLPLEFVNLSLVALPDSSVINGTTTDKKGNYEISNITIGNYFLRYKFIGYKQIESKDFSLNSKNQIINLDVVSMQQEDINLDEVTVTSNKIMMSNSIDRKIYNVQQDILSSTGSASDLLQNIPSVQVDIDGNVSLRGSANVLILINGKTSPLMGKTRAEVLQQMPASSIDKIEVITNPSAKYKPDGTAGIINIVLKKETGEELNGTITGNIGNEGRYNGNISLNYKTGDVNLFGRYSLRKDYRNGYSYVNRTQFDSSTGTPSYYDNNSTTNFRPLSHSISLGIDYNYDQLNSFGIAGDYFYRGFTRNDISDNVYSDSAKIITEHYERLRNDDEYEKEGAITAYAEHNFQLEDHKIRFDFNWSKSPEVEDNHYTNTYYVPAIPNTYDNTLIKQGSNNTQATLEYSNPLSEKSTLEAGYQGEFNEEDMDFYGEYYDSLQHAFVEDIQKTNHFVYDENINAIYATYSDEFGQLGFLGGLRFESAQLNSDLVSSGIVYNNQYYNIYPTLHLAYKLSDVSELQLNYSRRCNRPEGEDLNPFPEYQDPRNIRAGNPQLKPEFIHSIEFGYQWQNDNFTIVPSIFYRNKYNGFTWVTKPVNDSTLLTTHENLSTDQSAGFEFVLSSSFGNFFSANLSNNAYYEQIDASNIGFSSNKSTITWSGNISLNFNFPSSTMLQINSNFRSARLTPQGTQEPNYVVNLGLRQDLFEDKLSLVFTVSDIFNSLKREYNIDTSWLNENSVSRRNARVIYFGATFRFGNNSNKSKEKSLQYENGI